MACRSCSSSCVARLPTFAATRLRFCERRGSVGKTCTIFLPSSASTHRARLLLQLPAAHRPAVSSSSSFLFACKDCRVTRHRLPHPPRPECRTSASALKNLATPSTVICPVTAAARCIRPRCRVHSSFRKTNIARFCKLPHTPAAPFCSRPERCANDVLQRPAPGSRI